MAGEWLQGQVWGSGRPSGPHLNLLPCLHRVGPELGHSGTFFSRLPGQWGGKGGRAFEPRTHGAHWPVLGSEPWACLAFSMSSFLMCEGSPTHHCVGPFLVPGDHFPEKVMPSGCHEEACATLLLSTAGMMGTQAHLWVVGLKGGSG